MTVHSRHNMLTRLPVRLAMRRNPLRMSMNQNLSQAISSMIKYKVSSVLIHDDQSDQDQGLLAKTDLMTLYILDNCLWTRLYKMSW